MAGKLKLVQITVTPLTGDLRLRRLLCGKAPPFRGGRTPTTPLRATWKAQPSKGRGGEKTSKLGRKGGAFPHSGAAEPNRIRPSSANWDSLEVNSPLPFSRVSKDNTLRSRFGTRDWLLAVSCKLLAVGCKLLVSAYSLFLLMTEN